MYTGQGSKWNKVSDGHVASGSRLRLRLQILKIWTIVLRYPAISNAITFYLVLHLIQYREYSLLVVVGCIHPIGQVVIFFLPHAANWIWQ